MTVATMLSAALFGASQNPGVVKTEFVFETAPFAQCHASTIAESGGKLVAAWFGGTREGHPDVGIWVSRHDGATWSAPVQAANGAQADGSRHPCWNPVLFQPKQGALLLFYKVGPRPDRWWGMLTTSEDGGRTWSEARRLPEGILGPIKNKPVQLSDGALLCPSSTEHDGWRVHFERTADLGKAWERTGPLNDGTRIGAIQPALLTLEDGSLLALTRSRQGAIAQSRSTDGGKTWGVMTLTALPNPNSGLDAVTLADGRHLLVYNHSTRGRTPLNVAVSSDGRTWRAAVTLEDQPGEYSYPAVIQARDGTVHLTYTWNRVKVKHVVIEPARLVLRYLK
jgi:predicted neuraminidase